MNSVLTGYNLSIAQWENYLMTNELLEVFERARAFVEQKDKKNPLIKGNDRTLEMAYLQMREAVQRVDRIFKEVDEDLS